MCSFRRSVAFAGVPRMVNDRDCRGCAQKRVLLPFAPPTWVAQHSILKGLEIQGGHHDDHTLVGSRHEQEVPARPLCSGGLRPRGPRARRRGGCRGAKQAGAREDGLRGRRGQEGRGGGHGASREGGLRGRRGQEGRGGGQGAGAGSQACATCASRHRGGPAGTRCAACATARGRPPVVRRGPHGVRRHARGGQEGLRGLTTPAEGRAGNTERLLSLLFTFPCCQRQKPHPAAPRVRLA